jgi:hypothetical protein
MDVRRDGTSGNVDNISGWHNKPYQAGEGHQIQKDLSIHDSPSGGNATHLSFIKAKVSTWVNRMMNGHLPNHMAWITYKHQLWPGVQYGLGTMAMTLRSRTTSFTRKITGR